MRNPELTPGARRCLQRATAYALADGSSQIGAPHLLSAMWHEDTTAAETLRRLQISREQIDRFGHASGDNEPLPTGADSDLSPAANEILHNARAFHRLTGPGHGELNSQHLLLAFVRRFQDTAGQLGLTEAEVLNVIAPPPPTGPALKVHPEFSIQEEDDAKEPVPASDRGIRRAIDAAGNRAREGLRVAEDYARFVLGNQSLTEQLKTCRHDLTAALSHFDPALLLGARDVGTDPGRSVRTESEYVRSSAEAVARANLKRAQEALRTIEEFCKVCGGGAEAVERIRYQTYEIECSLVDLSPARPSLDGRTVYLLLTEALCAADWRDTALAALSAGVDVIQLREKELPDNEIVLRGRWLAQTAHEAGGLFIMNDRPDLAVLTDADGVHVGQTELSVSDVRRIVGPDRLIGVSTHHLRQARQAVFDGADYLGVGPVFEGSTKQFPEVAGPEYVTAAAGNLSIPWFAIGGITTQNVAEVAAAGAGRIAVTAAICGADDIAQAVRALKQSVGAD